MSSIKSFFLLASLLVVAQTCFAQLRVTKIDKKDIPANIKYTGHIINTAKYVDSEGEHLVIATETGEIPVKEKDFDGKSADLYAYHYNITGDNLKLSWQMHDFIKDCSLDMFAKFLPNTFAVTDLDKNGKAEVWLMYKTVCHGDVTPSTMKIIMHEGDKKFAVRGENRVKVSATSFEGGKYTSDDAFNNGPGEFKAYAADLWKKNILETWK